MNIGIFETEHFEGAYPVIKLFDKADNEITVFSTENTYRQFEFLFGAKTSHFNWVIQKPNEQKAAFVFRMRKEIRTRKIALLYLNTISDNFIFYAALVRSLKTVRVVLTLHDINTWFYYKHAWSVRRWVRHAGKRMLIRLITEFNVVSLTMVEHLRRKLKSTAKVYCVPGALYEPCDTSFPVLKPGAVIRIVVPGTLDCRRRNYGAVFELLNSIQGASIQVSITLLGGNGGIYGKEILQNCKVYAASHDNLFFYDKVIVDQPEFDQIMDHAHFVFIPSVIDTIMVDGVTEIYGLSKSSGNLFDVVKHAKPFIAPKALRVDPFLESSCLRYVKVEEIKAFLETIIQAAALYPQLQQEAENNSCEYTLQKVRSRNKDLFE